MPSTPRCFAVPRRVACSTWPLPSCQASFPARSLVQLFSTAETTPNARRSKTKQGKPALEEVAGGLRLEQERHTPLEQTAKAPTQEGKNREPTPWGPRMWANWKLCRRPGLTQFLELRELKKPPGLTFDPSTMSLSVSPSFPREIYFHEPTHHKVRPWVEKALLQRAKTWVGIDKHDMKRVRSPSRRMGRTSKRHRGCVCSHSIMISSISSRIQKGAYEPLFSRWCKNVAPELPERLYGHIDGILPEDAEIYIEDHESYIKGHSGRVLSCVWVAINASFSVAMRTCDDMAIGKPPHPDWDILTPLLQNFCSWFRTTYNNQREGQLYSRGTSAEGPRRPLPLLRDIAPPGHDIPVVLAFRHTYLLLIWKGGYEGRLTAQYQGHWLPIHEVETKPGVDYTINRLQLARLRRGADEGTIPITSGGKARELWKVRLEGRATETLDSAMPTYGYR